MHIFGSRLDYSNSHYRGLPRRVTVKLQSIQNSAARLISLIRQSDRITPVLKHFHWLPVEARDVFKILLLTYKILNGQAQDWLYGLSYYQISTKPYASLIQSFFTARSDSQDSNLCIEPTFSFYARKYGTSLSQGIKCSETFLIFISSLKP